MATTFVNGPEDAYTSERITDFSAAKGLTEGAYQVALTAQLEFNRIRRAHSVMISVETGAIRYTIDGTTPTTTAGTAVGHLGEVGDVITITGFDNIKNFKAINAVAANNAALFVTYFRI
jgi:hypothetical protein